MTKSERGDAVEVLVKSISSATPFPFLFLALFGCAGDPPTPLGQRCSVDDDCASGTCADVGQGFGLVCTEACTTVGERCDGTDVVCGAAGQCVPACQRGDQRGSGASLSLCTGGLFVECSSMNPAIACEECGCEPFGGGVCFPGEGCVQPAPDGEPCTADARCASGVCYRAEGVCGPARPMGMPCTVDAECETRNCSNDGDTSVAGVCNQPLGTTCTVDSGTCTRCVRPFNVGDEGVCSRRRCAPETHPSCPQYRGHLYTCERTTAGDYACFETCPLNDDALFHDCFEATQFCESGYCQ